MGSRRGRAGVGRRPKSGRSDDRAGVERISGLGQAGAIAAGEDGSLEFLGVVGAGRDRRFGRSFRLLWSQCDRLASRLVVAWSVCDRARLRGGDDVRIVALRGTPSTRGW